MWMTVVISETLRRLSEGAHVSIHQWQALVYVNSPCAGRMRQDCDIQKRKHVSRSKRGRCQDISPDLRITVYVWRGTIPGHFGKYCIILLTVHHVELSDDTHAAVAVSFW